MEISRSERIPSPAVAAPAAARAGRDAWLRYDRIAVGGLLTLQLCLYFFWSTTQFPAAPGTWWQPLFDRSGPVILPVMFSVQPNGSHIASEVRAWRMYKSCRRVDTRLSTGSGYMRPGSRR